jgi:hypothetical protein
MDTLQSVSQEHIDSQYTRLLTIVKETFGEDSERTVGLLKLYTDMAELIKWAPASGKLHYHAAYVGGYLDHVLSVYDLAIKLATTYVKAGGKANFSKVELVFAALNHDLGKIGDENGTYYIPEKSEWHREKQNKYFSHNKDIAYLTVFDRTMYLLSQYGVKISQSELLAIRLANGLFDDATKPYFLNHIPFPLSSNIGYILHWADHMATIIEMGQAQDASEK